MIPIRAKDHRCDVPTVCLIRLRKGWDVPSFFPSVVPILPSPRRFITLSNRRVEPNTSKIRNRSLFFFTHSFFSRETRREARGRRTNENARTKRHLAEARSPTIPWDSFDSEGSHRVPVCTFRVEGSTAIGTLEGWRSKRKVHIRDVLLW